MNLLGLALLSRLVLLAFGSWQDAHLGVKYTDIDYEVYTDAARFMAAGGSPYQRSTYRYTPLLAGALLPNVWLHKAWGKALFSAADLLAAWLFDALLRRRRASQRLRSVAVGLWLFSPLTATISTRGNGEALVTCMLLGMLLALGAGRPALAGGLYGLAVHWRVYPAIFAPALLCHLLSQQQGRLGRRPLAPAGTRTGGAASSVAARRALLPPAVLAFGAAAAGVFVLLGAGCYRQYGRAFLHESYLYHASRTDPRHNFSPYFYPAYLRQAAAAAGGAGAAPLPSDGAWAFAAAQAVLQPLVGWALAPAGLAPALLLQTMVLVAFNKVITAQYFVWYLSFLPLVLPDLAAAPNKARLVLAAAAWAAAVGLWLGGAYLLEFRGLPVHLGVWAASLAFLAAHAWLACELACAAGCAGGTAAKRARGPAQKRD